jgi:uncharacterized protein
MWKLYDELIESIPPELTADEIYLGAHHALVRCGEGWGFSVLSQLETRPVTTLQKLPGMKLRDLASCIRSWNFYEASVGQAAINAYYNEIDTAEKNGVKISKSRFAEDRKNDPFIAYQNEIKEKTVCVAGHFPYLEKLFEPICDLKILEEEPTEEGDYPYSAAEYYFPGCDYLFVSCSTIVEKTFPRFLRLAPQAKVIVVGPSTPMAPLLLQEYGVVDLAGFVIKDGERAKRICLGQEILKIYTSGQKVSFKIEDCVCLE